MATVTDSARITSMAKKRKTKMKTEKGKMENSNVKIFPMVSFQYLLQTTKSMLNFLQQQKNLLKKYTVLMLCI